MVAIDGGTDQRPNIFIKVVFPQVKQPTWRSFAHTQQGKNLIVERKFKYQVASANPLQIDENYGLNYQTIILPGLLPFSKRTQLEIREVDRGVINLPVNFAEFVKKIVREGFTEKVMRELIEVQLSQEKLVGNIRLVLQENKTR